MTLVRDKVADGQDVSTLAPLSGGRDRYPRRAQDGLHAADLRQTRLHVPGIRDHDRGGAGQLDVLAPDPALEPAARRGMREASSALEDRLVLAARQPIGSPGAVVTVVDGRR